MHLVGFHYKKVPLVPTTKQVVEAHIFCSYFVRAILILSSCIIMLFQKVSFLHVFLSLFSTHFAYPSAYHIPCPPFTFFLNLIVQQLHMVPSAKQQAPHCAVFSIPILFLPLSSQYTPPARLPHNTLRPFPGATPTFSRTELLTSCRLSESYRTSTTFTLVCPSVDLSESQPLTSCSVSQLPSLSPSTVFSVFSDSHLPFFISI